MSLPAGKPAQRSITSFFQSKPPPPPPPATTYAPPPSQISRPPPPPPPPPASSTPTAAGPTKTTATLQEIPPLPASLPREACIRRATEDDVNPLRRINALLLPVSYPDAFYHCLTDYADQGATSRVITWAADGDAAPKVVGGVVCRVEPRHPAAAASSPPTPQASTLYIRSLCILAPYRGLGLVSAALDNIVAAAAAAAAADPGTLGGHLATVSAHVWTENDEALRWYESRGFRRDTHPIEGYYRRLRPSTAWLVHRDADAPNPAARAPASSASPSRSVPPSASAAVVNLPPLSGAAPARTRPAPPRVGSGLSYQNQRPETEWNDLPVDMAGGPLAPPKKNGAESGSGSGSGSGTSSRSSSAVRKKRDRSYPAAAFGGP